MNFRSLLVSACVCAVLLGGAAFAQTAPSASSSAAASALPPSPTVTGPSKIAIIDIETAILRTDQGKKLNAAMQERFAPKQSQLQSESDAITKLQNQLNAGGNTMSAEAKASLQQQIARQQRDLQQDSTNAQSDFQQAQTDLLNTVGVTMMPLLKTYAEQHGYTAIIDVSMSWPQSPVLYYNPGIDITGDIVRLYDQAHPEAAASSTAKPSTSK